MTKYISLIQNILFASELEIKNPSQFQLYRQKFQSRAIIMANVICYFILLSSAPFVVMEMRNVTQFIYYNQWEILILFMAFLSLLYFTFRFYQFENLSFTHDNFKLFLYGNVTVLLFLNFFGAWLINPQILNYYPMLFSIAYLNIGLVLSRKFRLYFTIILIGLYIGSFLHYYHTINSQNYLEFSFWVEILFFFFIMGQISFSLFKSSVNKHISRKESLEKLESQNHLIEKTLDIQQSSIKSLFDALDISWYNNEDLKNPIKLSESIYQLIQELEESRKQQKKERERFEDIFNTVSDGIMQRDKNWNVCLANSNIDKITGFSFSQGGFFSFNPLISKIDQDAYYQYLKKLKSGQNAHFTGTLNTNRKQANILVEIHSSPIMKEGEFEGSRDIVRHLSQEENERKKNLIDLEKERSQILKMQDQLRNPINALIGFSALLSDAQSPQEIELIQQNIQKACTSLKSYLIDSDSKKNNNPN